MGWYLNTLQNAGYYSGRMGRREFWTFALINAVVIGVLAGLIDWSGRLGRTGIRGGAIAVLVVFCLMIFFPTVAAAARRVHDTGRAAPSFPWNNILWPFALAVIIIYCLLPGQAGPNQYGPAPRSRTLSPPEPGVTAGRSAVGAGQAVVDHAAGDGERGAS